MDKKLAAAITEFIQSSDNPTAAVNEIRGLIHQLSPNKDQPVDYVQWVPIEKVRANDYNPNSVAKIEMSLLATSIDHDGYTQPIVTVYDDLADEFIIVDGFHRYFVEKTNQAIFDRCKGLLPLTVIDKGLNDRMASTIRHNRARGRHSVTGMSNLIFEMLEGGWSDAEICNELGMQPEELLRLKHITGFSKLFKDQEYHRAWTTRRQILIEQEFKKNELASGPADLGRKTKEDAQ